MQGRQSGMPTSLVIFASERDDSFQAGGDFVLGRSDGEVLVETAGHNAFDLWSIFGTMGWSLYLSSIG